MGRGICCSPLLDRLPAKSGKYFEFIFQWKINDTFRRAQAIFHSVSVAQKSVHFENIII